MCDVERRNRRLNLAAPLLIVAAGLLAYSNTFRVPFLFDDLVRIVDEPAIRTLWPPWPAMHNTNRPFGQLTFALNYSVHGVNVVGYHVVNLCIHLLAAVTLFGIVRRTLLRCDSTYRDHAAAIAFAAALIWVTHPLATQAVTYIVQRLESLMALAYLLTLYCFIRAQDARRGWLWSCLSVVACATGMGCKEVMATAPLVVLWYDRVFIATSWRELFGARWRYYVFLASSWGVLAWSMLHYTADYTSGALLRIEGLTPWTYLLTQSSVILHYLKLVFWPTDQCVYYAWPLARSLPDVALPFTVMAGLFTVTLWAIVRRPKLGFVAGCFFLVLAPTSSIVPIIDVAFEHRMYLPMVAVVLLVLLAVTKLQTMIFQSTPRTRAAFVGGAILLSVVLGAATLERNRVYESDISVWRDTLQKSPLNVKVWVGLGGIHAKEKNVAEAVRCFTTALAIEPDNAMANANYAGLLVEQGDYPLAQQHLQRALAADPRDRDAIANMGHLLFATARYAEAQDYFEAAVKAAPNDEELQTALVVNLSYLGQHEEVLFRTETNLQRRPKSARAHTDFAAALIAVGRSEEARRHCHLALELENSLARAHATLAMATAEQDLTAAIAHMATACQLDPQSFEFQLAMGNLQMMRSPSDAVKYYAAALASSPDNIEVLLRLGMAWDAAGKPEAGLPFMERVTQLKPDLIEAREMARVMRRSIHDSK